MDSETEKPSLRRILVGMDESDESKKALRWAVEELFRKGDRIHIVHCYPTLAPIVSRSMDICSGLTAGDDYEVRGAVRMLLTAKVHALETDDATHLLTDLAERLDVVAVVVGSRGHGKIKSALLGSVSSYLAHHCTKPVVILRPAKV